MESIDVCIKTLKVIMDNEGIKGTIGRSRGLRPERLYVYLHRKKDKSKLPSHVWGRQVTAQYTGQFKPARG
jgi:hypothetical protein